MVEFAVENKVKAKMQMEKVAQKKANKIKQKIENKEKQQQPNDKKLKEKKLGRGALQREKKRTRKEASEEGDEQAKQVDTPPIKKQKVKLTKETKPKLIKPQKKRKVDKDDDALEDMIRSYKSSFSKGGGTKPENKELVEETVAKSKLESRVVVTKRWFE
jgi:hypothetical protein